MSNIQLRAIPIPAGRLALCFLVSLPPLSNLLLIYPPKIKNGLKPMKTNHKEISNLSVAPANESAGIGSRLISLPSRFPASAPPEFLIYGSGIRKRSNSLKTQGGHHV